MARPLVIGNWKMHGSLADNAARLDAVAAGSRGAAAAVAVCVPFPYLAQARERLAATAVAWGAQNVSEFAAGAHSGEVAAAMLADFGCRYVLVGHSERRSHHHEDVATVARKLLAALRHGLTPLLCVGETLAEREAGRTEAAVAAQLEPVLAVAGRGGLGSTVIAYEPVWAIGSGRSASPEQAQAAHRFIRRHLASRLPDGAGVPLLYGGSVRAANAAELFAMPDVDGALVGGASLQAAEFLGICEAACHRPRVDEIVEG
jgi:triosephosphate isomerase